MDSCRDKPNTGSHSHRSSKQNFSRVSGQKPKNTESDASMKSGKSSSFMQTFSNLNVPLDRISQEDMKIKSENLAMVFNPSRDEVKPYHLDGDSSMYTEAALAKRQSIKSESIVINSINEFLSIYRSDAYGNVSRSEYERVHTILCNILRPSINPIEMRKIIEEDWNRDTKGSDIISREKLFDSMFELCDVWCPNIDAMEYKSFFDQLKFRIRYSGQGDRAAYDILK